jgi:hypothetical protein
VQTGPRVSAVAQGCEKVVANFGAHGLMHMASRSEFSDCCNCWTHHLYNATPGSAAMWWRPNQAHRAAASDTGNAWCNV